LKNMKEIENNIKEEAQKLLDLLNIQATVSVGIEDDAYKVEIDAGEENAFLIGKHGNTLASFELILKMIIAQKSGEYKQITIEIGNYRMEREEYLKGLVERLKEEVEETGSEKPVRGLKPWERRYVHMLLKDDEFVYSESEGEGRDRVLVIKKK